MVQKINYQELNEEEIISEIMKKKEFSDLPRKDVELVYSQFENIESVEERIKRTRELLMKMYTAFVSKKLLSLKEKEAEWFLNRHKSTKERLSSYDEVYRNILKSGKEKQDEISSDLNTSQITETRPALPNSEEISNKVKGKRVRVIDFGSGVNGFSYPYFGKIGYDVDYLGIEPVGQLVDLQNNFFLKKGWDAKCIQASLFDLKEIKKIVGNIIVAPRGVPLSKGEGKIGFFFKVLDSLEMLKRNYSKKVLKELVPLLDRCVVSWATKSLGDRKKIFATKKWLREFIEENFKIIDEFEVGGENYLVFENN